MRPLSKFAWKKNRGRAYMYMYCVHLSVLACVSACNKSKREREREMERGLEKGVEWWGGSLIWKVWREWRTSGLQDDGFCYTCPTGKRSILLFLSSIFSLCLRPPKLPRSHIINTQILLSPTSPATHIVSFFLLPWRLLLVWGHWATHWLLLHESHMR